MFLRSQCEERPLLPAWVNCSPPPAQTPRRAAPFTRCIMGKPGERVRVGRAGGPAGEGVSCLSAEFCPLKLRMNAHAIWEAPLPPNQGHMSR